MIMELFKLHKTCQHEKVKIDADFSYCPDCGELIENQWYIARCACCGVKLKANINKKGEIISQENFCHNCGSKNYIIERIDKINFIDISYAVLLKAIVTTEMADYIQSWTENHCHINNPKLLKTGA